MGPSHRTVDAAFRRRRCQRGADLEEVLTDLGYVSLKLRQEGSIYLLQDYDQALRAMAAQSERATSKSTQATPTEDRAPSSASAALDGVAPKHPTNSTRPTLEGLRNEARNGTSAPGFGLFLGGENIKRAPAADVRSANWFSTADPSSRTIAVMAQTAAGGTPAAAADRTPHHRVEEFAAFVRTWLPANNTDDIDVLTLAYNQSATGAVAESASSVIKQLKAPWIRRCIRPVAPQSDPLVLQSFAGLGEVAITPDFRRAVIVTSATKDTENALFTMKILDALTARVDKELRVPGNGGLSLPDHMLLSADTETVLFGGNVWNIKRGKLQGMIDPPTRAVAMSADGQLAVTAESDTALQAWDLQTAQLRRTIECANDEVHSLSLSADGLILAVGCHSGEMQVFDVSTGQCLLTLMTGHHVRSVALTPDSRFVVLGGGEGFAAVMYLPQATLQSSLEFFPCGRDTSSMAIFHRRAVHFYRLRQLR